MSFKKKEREREKKKEIYAYFKKKKKITHKYMPFLLPSMHSFFLGMYLKHEMLTQNTEQLNLCSHFTGTCIHSCCLVLLLVVGLG